MATYNTSVEYDITCDTCDKYFDENDVDSLEESYYDIDHKTGNRHTYYKCNVEGCCGEVLVIT